MINQKTFLLRDEGVRAYLLDTIVNLPADEDKPLQITIHPYSPKRKKKQNDYAWSGMINDFIEQGIVNGRQFNSKIWHDYLKEKFLPEVPDPELTLPGYQKWAFKPDGSLTLVGSTTKLTIKGFSNYLNDCMAFGAQELGIMFTTRRDHG